MAIKAPPIDDITKLFTHLILPNIVGQPTYQANYEVHKLLMENASTIPPTIGGGNHGHLGQVIKAPKFLQLTGRLTKEWHNHCAALVTFQTHNNTDKALRNQLIAAVKD
eukprot:9717970-Ditylum_brightwellii.AAC.1